MANTCGKGIVANQLQACLDISAVGIKSITQSSDLTKLYVTYTNNTTQTFTLPEAAPLPILYGTGAPAGTLGAVGQTYIDTTGGGVYLKTGVAAWTFELNIIGAPGATGAAGAAGTNGTTVLYNDLTNTTNGATVNTLTPLKTYALPANKISTVGSKIIIRGYIENGDVADLSAQITVGGVVVLDTPLVLPATGSVDSVAYEVSVSKTGTGTAGVEFTYRTMSGNNVIKQYQSIPNAPYAIDWTISNNVVILGSTPTASAAICRQLEVDLFLL